MTGKLRKRAWCRPLLRSRAIAETAIPKPPLRKPRCAKRPLRQPIPWTVDEDVGEQIIRGGRWRNPPAQRWVRRPLGPVSLLRKRSGNGAGGPSTERVSGRAVGGSRLAALGYGQGRQDNRKPNSLERSQKCHRGGTEDKDGVTDAWVVSGVWRNRWGRIASVLSSTDRK